MANEISSLRERKLFGMSLDFLAVMILVILPLIYLFNMTAVGMVGAQLFGQPIAGTIQQKSGTAYDWSYNQGGRERIVHAQDTDLHVEFERPGDGRKTIAYLTVPPDFWSRQAQGKQVEIYAMSFWPYGVVIRGTFWGCRDVRNLMVMLALGFGLIGGVAFALRKEDTKA